MNHEPSILVIDDQIDNYEVIEAFLYGQGYTLHYASSGERIFETLDIVQPDVILLDLMMPGTDGLEVCRQIRMYPKWSAVPIIIVTALTAKEDLYSCLQAGADDFISKPVHKLELLARTQSLLRIKQQYDTMQSLLQSKENTIRLLQNSFDEMRSSIAHSISHEFNTPMNGIIAPIEMLIADNEIMSAQDRIELLELVNISGNHLNHLVQNFLTYSQLELINADPERVKSIRADLTKTAIQPIVEYTARAQAKYFNRSSDLVLQIDTGHISIRRKDLEKIVEELVNNAFKFSCAGSQVQVVGRQLKDQYELIISNVGTGLKTSQIAKISTFVQYGRKQNEQDGMGLGLAIVSQTLKIYDGAVHIIAETDQKISAIVTLPSL